MSGDKRMERFCIWCGDPERVPDAEYWQEDRCNCPRCCYAGGCGDSTPDGGDIEERTWAETYREPVWRSEAPDPVAEY